MHVLKCTASSSSALLGVEADLVRGPAEERIKDVALDPTETLCAADLACELWPSLVGTGDASSAEKSLEKWKCANASATFTEIPWRLESTSLGLGAGAMMP